MDFDDLGRLNKAGREAKRRKCLKKDFCYQPEHQLSKHIGECEELKLPSQLFREFRLFLVPDTRQAGSLETHQDEHYEKHQDEHYKQIICASVLWLEKSIALHRRSLVLSAVQIQHQHQQQRALLKLGFVRIRFDKLFCRGLIDFSGIHLSYWKGSSDSWIADYWIAETAKTVLNTETVSRVLSIRSSVWLPEQELSSLKWQHLQQWHVTLTIQILGRHHFRSPISIERGMYWLVRTQTPGLQIQALCVLFLPADSIQLVPLEHPSWTTTAMPYSQSSNL